MGVCQMIITALYMISIGINLARDGEPRDGKYSFLGSLIGTFIIVFLLWKGGFY